LNRRLPRLDARVAVEPGRSLDAIYLRAAQAYMLISMPTDTSTILGAFQVIPFSHEIGTKSAPKLNLGPRPTSRKRGKLSRWRPRIRADGQYFSCRQGYFSFGQHARRPPVIMSKITSQIAACGKRCIGT
jgi:hypothetical protein